jgi:hypothetical protein
MMIINLFVVHFKCKIEFCMSLFDLPIPDNWPNFGDSPDTEVRTSNIWLQFLAPIERGWSWAKYMGQSEVLLETRWGTRCELDENKVKTWWEQQKSTKPYYPDVSYPPPPSWNKSRSKPRGALEKMDEVPGSRPEGCVRQVAFPLKLTSFLWQILIIILVPDNHSFTHTSTLQHLRSGVVVEGGSLRSCTLMKLVKWEGSTRSLLALGN